MLPDYGCSFGVANDHYVLANSGLSLVRSRRFNFPAHPEGRLASLEAPDFTLPDLDGRPHSLSDYRGQKILLAAYASW